MCEVRTHATRSVRLFKEVGVVPIPLGVDCYRAITLENSEEEFKDDGPVEAKTEVYKIRTIQHEFVHRPDGRIFPEHLINGFRLVRTDDGVAHYRKTFEYAILDGDIDGLLDSQESANETLRSNVAYHLREEKKYFEQKKKIKHIGLFRRVFRWKKSIREIES